MDPHAPPRPEPRPENRPEPRPEPPAEVDVIMLAADGGRVNRWLIGPAKGIPLHEPYDFRPCCPTTVSAADAKALLAGGPWVGNRRFVRADSAEGRAAIPKAPGA